MEIRPLVAADRDWVASLVAERWGAPLVVGRGRTWSPAGLPGFAAVEEGEVVGLLTYELDGDACEIVTLDALRERRGIATALLDAVARAARAAGATRLRVLTTNDNLPALALYQTRGFELAALRPGAVAAARRLKPSIAEVGHAGIPIRDELDLERRL